MLYDGSPFARDGRILFDYAQRERFSHFGTSAKFIDAIAKRGLKPRETHPLPGLRMIVSTGSPLVPESYEYVYRDVKQDVCLSSISGGTDIMAAFADANPVLPVYAGELQCRSLGLAVEVYDEDGQCGRGAEGRAGVHQALSLDAARLLERPRRREATTRRTSPSTRTSGATATGASSPSAAP